jgi:biotin carboxyl carrier protein
VRIKKTESEAREKFLMDLFRKQPTLSVAKANQQLQEKFGSQMRAQRAYELRDVAAKEVESASKPQPQQAQTAARKVNKRTTSAGRIVNAPIVGENKNRLVVLEGTSENISFLKEAIEAINGAGLARMNVDIANDKYAVVRS